MEKWIQEQWCLAYLSVSSQHLVSKNINWSQVNQLFVASQESTLRTLDILMSWWHATRSRNKLGSTSQDQDVNLFLESSSARSSSLQRPASCEMSHLTPSTSRRSRKRTTADSRRNGRNIYPLERRQATDKKAWSSYSWPCSTNKLDCLKEKPLSDYRLKLSPCNYHLGRCHRAFFQAQKGAGQDGKGRNHPTLPWNYRLGT